MNDYETAEVSLKDELDLRGALQDAISQICVEEEIASDDSGHMSSDGVVALTELVYQYATTSLSSDLLLFSKHAGRRTVQVDDVMLAARKDPDGLLSKLRHMGAKANIPAFRSTTTAASSGGRVRSSDSSPMARETVAMTPMTQRMQAWRERLEKGIDTSSSSDDDDKMQTDEEIGGNADTKPPARKRILKPDKENSQAIEWDDSFDCGDPLGDTAASAKENAESNHRKEQGPSKDLFGSSDDDDLDVRPDRRLRKSAASKHSLDDDSSTDGELAKKGNLDDLELSD